MNVFVLNCGSSSLKFQLIETDPDLIEKDGDRMLAKGLVERVGSEAIVTLQAGDHPPLKQASPLRDHRAALAYVIKWMTSAETQIPGISSLSDVHAVGHRVVHGEERFKRSIRIDNAVIGGIEDCIDLAPLHNPANLKGIYAARELFGPNVPQVAVFDTAFHSTLPEASYLYAVPYQLYRRFRVRRYGFHGTSHRYVAYRYRQLTGKSREDTNIITLHLGNGCSACAIKRGQVDRHVDGHDAARGADDGDAFRRHRRGDRRVPDRQGASAAASRRSSTSSTRRAASSASPA